MHFHQRRLRRIIGLVVIVNSKRRKPLCLNLACLNRSCQANRQQAHEYRLAAGKTHSGEVSEASAAGDGVICKM